jgi:hypothetical protein
MSLKKKLLVGLAVGVTAAAGSGVAYAAFSTHRAVVPVSATYDIFPTAPVTYDACVAKNGDQFIVQHASYAGNQTDTSPGAHPVSLTGYLVVSALAYIDTQTGSPYQGTVLIRGDSTLYTDNTMSSVIYTHHFFLNGHLTDQAGDAIARGAVIAKLTAGGHLIGNQEITFTASNGQIHGHFGDADGGTPDFSAETQGCQGS